MLDWQDRQRENPRDWSAAVGPFTIELKRVSALCDIPRYRAEIVSAGIKYPLFYNRTGDILTTQRHAEAQAQEVLAALSVTVAEGLQAFG